MKKQLKKKIQQSGRTAKSDAANMPNGRTTESDAVNMLNGRTAKGDVANVPNERIANADAENKILSHKQLWLMAIGICMLYAASDEFHQWFVPGRSSEIMDVGIDTMGALLGTSLVVAVAISKWKKHRKEI